MVEEDENDRTYIPQNVEWPESINNQEMKRRANVDTSVLNYPN